MVCLLGRRGPCVLLRTRCFFLLRGQRFGLGALKVIGLRLGCVFCLLFSSASGFSVRGPLCFGLFVLGWFFVVPFGFGFVCGFVRLGLAAIGVDSFLE